MTEEKFYFKENKIIAYLVEMSNKRNVKVDPDEIGKVYNGIASGSIIRVRQGIINPSFIVDVVLDEDRVKQVRIEKREVEEHNRLAEISAGGLEKRNFKGLERLNDIFENMPKLGTSKVEKLNKG